MKQTDYVPQCQHRPDKGGKCAKCLYPMDAKVQSGMMTSLLDNLSKPIKVVGNAKIEGL